MLRKLCTLKIKVKLKRLLEILLVDNIFTHKCMTVCLSTQQEVRI